jgi:release factor glutamine methyltransferase
MNAQPAKPGTGEKWTIRRLLRWTSQFLESKGVDAPRLSAELLLAHVLEVPRIRLYTDLDRPASPLERAAYRELVEKAAAHHPIQYLIGEAHFFSLRLEVDPRVLVPRPSTETLVEHVIWQTRHIPGFAVPAIADIGTGSGCIAIALAKNLPEARITATDTSSEALELARHNAEQHGVAERIDFFEGPLYEPLRGRHFSFVVSDPPYISDAEWAEVPRNVREHDPARRAPAGSCSRTFRGTSAHSASEM